MVAGEGHGDDGPAVGEGVGGDLAPLKALLDHDPPAGVAEDAADHHLLQGRQRLLLAGGDHGALAGRQAVGLDHQGALVRPHEGGRLVEGVEGAEGGGGYAVALHEDLGEDLAGLDLGGGAAGPEGGDAGDGQAVDQAPRQGLLGPDDDEVDAPVAGGGGQPLDVVRRDGQVLGDVGGAGVARRDE